MAEITNGRGKYNLDFLMIPSEHLDRFNDFMTQYGELSDAEIYREILNTKTKVSTNVLNQHVSNLDALSQMTGFVTDSSKQRIQMVKRVLATDTGSNSHSTVETQFFGGTSLLLWFLTLAAIWRRPFYGFGRGGFGRRPFF